MTVCRLIPVREEWPSNQTRWAYVGVTRVDGVRIPASHDSLQADSCERGMA